MYGPGHVLFSFADPRIAESSGLVASTRFDLLFTHNDSGDSARFFAVDRAGRTRATYLLRGVQARDWEDISRGPGGTLWLGDIGDNKGIRDRGLLVHRVAEPDGRASGTVSATSYRLRYEDRPRDAEALIVSGGQVLVVEKTLGSRAGVYATTAVLRSDAVNVLHRVAEVPVPTVTAGDLSPDGRKVVLRNYTAAYEWDVPGSDVVAAFATEPDRIELPRDPQGEGIAYGRDGRSLLTSSEGRGAQVHELDAAADIAPSAAPEPRDRGGVGWRLPVLVGALALLGALVAGLVRR
ncbi:MAG: hypothetical protein LC789_12605 [Actinobacteria bacterium]|nr:hypothetical protein [Actinomycetota bacterium]MCA1721935.1 hypothetical protein [Actinomycetota bacterium]